MTYFSLLICLELSWSKALDGPCEEPWLPQTLDALPDLCHSVAIISLFSFISSRLIFSVKRNSLQNSNASKECNFDRLRLRLNSNAYCDAVHGCRQQTSVRQALSRSCVPSWGVCTWWFLKHQYTAAIPSVRVHWCHARVWHSACIGAMLEFDIQRALVPCSSLTFSVRWCHARVWHSACIGAMLEFDIQRASRCEGDHDSADASGMQAYYSNITREYMCGLVIRHIVRSNQAFSLTCRWSTCFWLRLPTQRGELKHAYKPHACAYINVWLPVYMCT